jgi:hypothetical protein
MSLGVARLERALCISYVRNSINVRAKTSNNTKASGCNRINVQIHQTTPDSGQRPYPMGIGSLMMTAVPQPVLTPLHLPITRSRNFSLPSTPSTSSIPHAFLTGFPPGALLPALAVQDELPPSGKCLCRDHTLDSGRMTGRNKPS